MNQPIVPDPEERCYVTDGLVILFAGSRAQCERWVLDARAEHRNRGSIPPHYRIFPERTGAG